MKTFDPDDPMLTAYALGELEGEERREIEELVARDPEAARHVESVRAAAAGFGEAFEQEESPEVEPIRAIEIEPRQDRAAIPFLYYVSTAIGACFFIVLAVRLVNPSIDEPSADKAARVAAPTFTEKRQEAAANMPMEEAVRQEASEVARRDAAAARAKRAESEHAALEMAKSKAASEVREEMAGALAKDEDQSIATGSAPGSTDNLVASDIPEPPPAAGEMKAAPESPPVADLNLAGAAEGDEIRLQPFSVVVTGPATYKSVDSIRDALAARHKVTRIDIAVLLADLGYSPKVATSGGVARNADLGNTTLSQTTTEQSPEHDPEAALERSVERFAQLLATNTPSNNESWDRALADARYAAGDNEKRMEFVQVIETARKMARAPATH